MLPENGEACGWLRDWPGKSAREGGPEHPAVYHMLDVAAVAEVLLAPLALPPERKAAFALLVALHDLGKISSSFRNMLRSGARQPLRHWQMTEAWLFPQLGPLSARLGLHHGALKPLIGAIAGHHGWPSRVPEMEYRHQLLRMPDPGAEADARAVVAALLALWPAASLAGMRPAEANRLSWWLAGLTTAADWIGSNAEWFPALEAGPPVADYLRRARTLAPRAVTAAGVDGCPIRQGWLFDFPLEAARPMQQAAGEIPLPDGPVLAFIEDETGAGKTEAMFILLQRMLRAGKGRGLFNALPTMATADAMFRRAAPVLGRLLDAPSVTLAHGRAGLSETFRDLVGRAAESDDITCAPWLADSRRRALLADVGIGTVDQALLAVLPTKFATLRLWGLSGKILVVDEAHELGQPYMAGQLERLLRVHAGQGGSAILMSATLPLDLRRRFTRAFQDGAGIAFSADPDPAYPALSIAGGERRRRFPARADGKGRVAVTRLPGAEAAVAAIRRAAEQGAACLWVRNAVDDAIAAAELLRELGIPAQLLHARFALEDRKRIEAEVLARYGRAGRARAGVLVSTQVVESSLDLDFDVMISDLAPMAALIQRAGRLWRHMDLRPAASRPVPAPVLQVVAPDPAAVPDDRWLRQVLDRGAFVYPLAEQWRTADVLFRAGGITAPDDLRGLIEAVHGAEAGPVPPVLETAEIRDIGTGFAEGDLARQNVIDETGSYREGGGAADDRTYPTRLGSARRTLLLARREGTALRPWAEVDSRQAPEWAAAEAWMRSEVSVRLARLQGLDLPDQQAAEVLELTQGWPDWRRAEVVVCPVAAEGHIAPGLRYDRESGLLVASPHTRG